MDAIVRHKRAEHFSSDRFRPVLYVFMLIAGGACKQDAPVPAVDAPSAPQVPIVDMSPSAQRTGVPASTPVVGVEPVATEAMAAPAPRAVPSHDEATVSSSDLAILRSKGLVVPVAGVAASALAGSFNDTRGSRAHEAMDIGAPRGTPVLSTEGGTVLKLFTSKGGGLTVYVADPSKKFIYYYAHLDAYAPALAEGQAVAKGQQIGTVGTTGNAPPNTPHLHFAILRNDDMSRWWTGTAIDPFLVFRPASGR